MNISSLSSVKAISGGPNQLFLATKFSTLSLTTAAPPRTTTIRMGGGPRTYPGGVSKWQWKRMQAKKAKQLLKARLARERQIYEMRKRAELKAAVSELERPWEVVEKPPTLFSVGADEQLKVLADRFQKPGGFDMWSERDGPELFKPEDGLPSARFFPKGVVHSVKPYGKIERIGNGSEEHTDSGSESGRAGNRGDYVECDLAAAMRGVGKSVEARKKSKPMNLKNNKVKKKMNKRMIQSEFVKNSSNDAEEVYDLRLQEDGHYDFRPDD